jgi:Fe-S cluster assembly protein SufD
MDERYRRARQRHAGTPPDGHYTGEGPYGGSAPRFRRALPCPPYDREEVRTLHTFTVDGAAGLPGTEWLVRRRVEAFADFEAMPMPSEKEEVWRYSPIDSLDLDAFRPVPVWQEQAWQAMVADPAMATFAEGLAADVPDRSAVALVRDGRVVSVDRSGLPDRVVVGGLVGGTGSALPEGAGSRDLPRPGAVLTGGDALVRLNDAFLPDTVVVDVPPGVVVEGPIVVVHWCAGSTGGGQAAGDTAPSPASFPRTAVRVGAGATGRVVEVVAGAPGSAGSLVLPVTEVEVEDGGSLAYVALQVVGTAAWHLGRLAGRVGRDAALRTFAVGLGGTYDRTRTDVEAAGTGAHCEVRSAYLGTGEQVHDVRTLQDHLAAHTTSELLCKGAVSGSSRSVYSGLIRVRHGAVRAEAFQTNHNLVLDPHAHADSVPNLDIEENDVRCSHASTVGPVDEDQRYYLESRGVPPGRAEELIVLGFFDDVVDRSPVPSVARRLRREIGDRLADALGAHVGEGPADG